MAHVRTYTGTPAELAERLLALPGARTYRVTVTSDDSVYRGVESLEAAVARMCSRTPDQVAAARARVLAATPPPRALPDGKTLLDVIMGTWPGDETGEEITTALEMMS